MTSKEFFKQIELVSEEKGISVDDLLEAFKKSLLNAYKRTYGNQSARVEIKPEKHELNIYSCKIVVNEVDPNLELEYEQISLEDAKKKSPRYKEGDIIEEAINPKEFGRFAATTAKQVFNQNIRNFEKTNAYKYFKENESELINGKVIQVQDNFVTLDIDYNTTTLLPKKEMLPDDVFNVNDKVLLVITKVEDTTKGPKVFVSRTDKNFIIRLFERNIPELLDGTIEIMGIARDPGDRTKLAVYSNDPKVDPRGACIGKNESRLNEVKRYINNEKIDLYVWSNDPITLVKNALQPATVKEVINVDLKHKSSLAIVPDDQLSLAIGRQGQNVRLAVQSSGWKIDIKPESEVKQEN